MSISKRHVKAFFAAFSKARAALPNSAGNLFESFVFLAVCSAAIKAGFHVSLKSPSPGIFPFRASPGPLNYRFGYALLRSRRGIDYELHSDLEVLGHSGMEHEADILLINLDSQPKPISAKIDHLRLMIECKLYGDANRLKGEVRKFVGAVVDWSRQSHTSHNNNTPQGCLHCGTGFIPFFVTNVRKNVRPDIEAYIATHDMIPVFSVNATSRGKQVLVVAIEKELINLP